MVAQPRRSGAVARALLLALLLALLAAVLFPLLIVALNAFKTPDDYASNGPLAWPQALSLRGIGEFWVRVDFTGKLANSMLISLSVALCGVALSLLNAFALGIGRVRGRAALLIFFLVANTLPQEALAYPLYTLARTLRIYDTQFAVILVFSVIQSAFGTYLLAAVLGTFPREIVEAALLDGCSKAQLLLRVVLPFSAPTLAVLFTFFFIWTWNEFFLPLVLLVSNARQTVPLAIALLQGQYSMDVTTISASALLGMLPCVAFFLLFQRTLTRGITAGSVK